MPKVNIILVIFKLVRVENPYLRRYNYKRKIFVHCLNSYFKAG